MHLIERLYNRIGVGLNINDFFINIFQHILQSVPPALEIGTDVLALHNGIVVLVAEFFELVLVSALGGMTALYFAIDAESQFALDTIQLANAFSVNVTMRINHRAILQEFPDMTLGLSLHLLHVELVVLVPRALQRLMLDLVTLNA